MQAYVRWATYNAFAVNIDVGQICARLITDRAHKDCACSGDRCQTKRVKQTLRYDFVACA
jgi:hypothetical protein